MCLFSCKKLVIYCTLSFELMFNYYFIIKPCNYARGKDIHGVSFDFDFTSYVHKLLLFFSFKNIISWNRFSQILRGPGREFGPNNSGIFRKKKKYANYLFCCTGKEPAYFLALGNAAIVIVR